MTHTRASITRAAALAAVLAAGLAGCSGSSTTTSPTTSSTSATSTTASSAAPTSTTASTEAATTSATSDTQTPSESAGTAGAADGKAIVTKALANAKAATSGTVSGTMASQGKNMTIDLSGTADAKTTTAKVGMGTSGALELLIVAGATYLKADATFAKSQGGGQFPAGKWVKLPSQLASAGFSSFSFSSLVNGIANDLSPQDISDKVTEERVGTIDCFVVTDTKGTTKAFVDKATGNFVRFESLDGKGKLDFSGWNQPVNVKAPADAISIG